MQPIFRKKLNFDFLQKRLFHIKTVITFAYELGKNCVIYEKVSTRKATSNFTGKYKSRKILGFAQKK
jgi:hypothetical protein